MATSTPILEINQLAVAYKVRGGEVEAVCDLELTIGRGQSFGLVGESGCGKTTVAWAIVNFLGTNGYIKRGSIRFKGRELAGVSGPELNRLRGNQIAMVYQNPMQALNPSMCIADQLKETLIVHQQMAAAKAHSRCVEILDRVHMPDPSRVLQLYPHQLSGGQQQRVVIAMALLNEPALLIMDEPTTALDVTVEATVLDLIQELRRDLDTALLFISHNLGIVARVCDEVGVMYAGELVERAPVRTLFKTPRHPYTQGLLRCIPRLGDSKASRVLYPIPGQVPPPAQRPSGCHFSPRCDYATERCAAEHPTLDPLEKQWTRCHLAAEIDPAGWKAPAQTRPAGVAESPHEGTTLQVENLETHYEQRTGSLGELLGRRRKKYLRALDGVSFELPQGKTLGIVGESGCGKSTLVKTLIGLEPSAGGDAEFMGFDLTQDLKKRDTTLLRELQMVFQDPDSTLNPAYTVGYQIGRVLRRFGAVPAKQLRAATSELLNSVRLDQSYYERYPRQLSGGEKQRVGIARAFASPPELVLCDEPVSALDVSVQAAILNLLLDIQQQQGTTMVFIAHDLGVVRFFSDFVAVMYLGKIMEIGTAESIYAPPFPPYTEALLSAAPIPDPDAPQTQIRLQGNVPSALDPPAGCPFHTRCPRRHLLADGGALCASETPPWRPAANGHRIFCHLPLDTLARLEPVVASPQSPRA